jgi:hypothetical protein
LRIPVEIAGYEPGPPAPEAYIEGISQRGECIELDVLLGDGRDGTARLSAADWEWLGFAAGDIVPVRYIDAE